MEVFHRNEGIFAPSVPAPTPAGFRPPVPPHNAHVKAPKQRRRDLDLEITRGKVMRKKGRRDETVSQRFVAGVPAAEAAPRCSRRRPGTRFDSCEAPRGAGIKIYLKMCVFGDWYR